MKKGSLIGSLNVFFVIRLGVFFVNNRGEL
jgi:hypothetical protein